MTTTNAATIELICLLRIVAEIFVKTGVIKIQGHEMKVLVPPSPHTLFVRSVSNDMNEMLELFLESPKKGGGTITDYSFDVGSETVTVSFEEQEGLWCLISKIT